MLIFATQKEKMKKLVLFDLDGTLVDTIADLAQATNHALLALGFRTHHEAEYRLMVGNGINKLFERALPEAERTEDNVQKMRRAFVPYYNRHNTDLSRPYRGMVELLEECAARGQQLGVASNKYQEAAEQIVRHFFPAVPFVRVLGQREGRPAKPDPAIVVELMEAAGVEREEVLYVGDSGVDMQTGLNAGVETCGVVWGFRPRGELEKFAPQHLAEHVEDLRTIIRNS